MEGAKQRRTSAGRLGRRRDLRGAQDSAHLRCTIRGTPGPAPETSEVPRIPHTPGARSAAPGSGLAHASAGTLTRLSKGRASAPTGPRLGRSAVVAYWTSTGKPWSGFPLVSSMPSVAITVSAKPSKTTLIAASFSTVITNWLFVSPPWLATEHTTSARVPHGTVKTPPSVVGTFMSTVLLAGVPKPTIVSP